MENKYSMKNGDCEGCKHFLVICRHHDNMQCKRNTNDYYEKKKLTFEGWWYREFAQNINNPSWLIDRDTFKSNLIKCWKAAQDNKED